MVKRYKVFWEISEDLEGFEDFRGFNDYLESNPNIWFDDILTSYEKVLLWEETETGLDVMVKQAMYDVWRWVNWVINFSLEKFFTKLDLFKDFLCYIGVTLPVEIREDQSFSLVLKMESGKEIKLDISLKNTSFDKLKSDLEKMYNMLSAGWNLSLGIYIRENSEKK